MLKSTHKAVGPVNCPAESLPPGWTEHKAPTGHSYYYNAETKQSTYTRPTAPSLGTFFIDHTAASSPFGLAQAQTQVQTQPPYTSRPAHGSDQGGIFRGGLSYQDRSRRKHQQDRPKKKKSVPGCEPWILVTTKMGRRFVYNPEKNESFWKFPQHVLLATFEMDRKEQEKKQSLEQDRVQDVATTEPRPDLLPAQQNGGHSQREADDSDSYEEVEVTDNEDAGPDSSVSNGGPSKKPRMDLTHQADPPAPVEFNEEDIAYQLAQMGQDYGLDPGEYDNGDDNEHDTGLALSVEDSRALFYELLSDHAINPYTTWDKILEEGHIIDDERYVALPNMRARKEAFTAWSTERIRELQEKRAKEEKLDPVIPYLKFLHDHATPRLYWPEFKRKYRKEEAMTDAQLSDKEREKFYRGHINQLKLQESTRKAQLKELLKSVPPEQLHRNSTLNKLPASLLTDLRLISLPPQTRDPLIEAYISTLPFPSSQSNTLDALPSGQVPADKRAADELEKQARALREREKQVQEEKRKLAAALQHGKEMMRDGERETDEALRLSGRQGLRAYMTDIEMEGVRDGSAVPVPP
jgi:FF domain/WW domain